MRLLSFGGGVQSTALAILVAEGKVQVDAILFADPGAEMPETYENVRAFPEVVWVRDETPLEDWLLTKSTPIPIRTASGLGHRQCTNQWKIAPIKRYAREQGAKKLTMVLGISADEVLHRMKPDREKWVRREYPLVDMRLTRRDCEQIITSAGMSIPPKSACFFCPFQSAHRWRVLAAEHPDLWSRSLAIEVAINGRSREPAYLTTAMRPLEQIASTNQLTFDSLEAAECEGVCFV